jgi:hypothetical protein
VSRVITVNEDYALQLLHAGHGGDSRLPLTLFCARF